MSRRYNPDVHHRRSIRLRGWDYRTPAAYFVTICTHERVLLFEDSRHQAIADNIWQSIPTQPSRQHVQLDAWVVMPNHVHGILILVDPRSTRDTDSAPIVARSGRPGGVASPLSDLQAPIAHSVLQNAEAGSLGAIVGSYKSQVTRRINCLRRTPATPVWQRSFYEHIVRSADDMDRIRAYIHDNPARWAMGRDDLDVLLAKMRRHG